MPPTLSNAADASAGLAEDLGQPTLGLAGHGRDGERRVAVRVLGLEVGTRLDEHLGRRALGRVGIKLIW